MTLTYYPRDAAGLPATVCTGCSATVGEGDPREYQLPSPVISADGLAWVAPPTVVLCENCYRTSLPRRSA